MTERSKQALVSFFIGLLIVEIPVAVNYLTAIPQPDEKVLLAGILGGLLTMLKRYSETAPNSVAALHRETYAAAAPPATLLDDPRRK